MDQEYKTVYIDLVSEDSNSGLKFECKDHNYDNLIELYKKRIPLLLLINAGSRKFYCVDYFYVPESTDQHFVFEGQLPIYWSKDNTISNINSFSKEDDYAKFHISKYNT